MARLAPVLIACLVLGAQPATAPACPFCGVVGESLAERRDAADIVVVGEATGMATERPDGVRIQSFRIAHVLRGAAPTDDVIGDARVDETIIGTALVFGRKPAAVVDWSAVAANEAVLAYVAAAPETSLPAAERLRWFASRLEHPDPVIATDAFAEFGLAPFAAVRDAADAFDASALEEWIGEPGIDPRRRGFYGLVAGLLAARTPDAAVRHRLLATIRAAIRAPVDDFRPAFDGLLAGLLVAEGEAGLDELIRLGLAKPTARPIDQRHFLTALRFAAESLGDTIPRQRVARVTAELVDSPAVAADAVVDLARYRVWEPVETVAALWDTLGVDDPLVRRAVAGYLDACPLPVAHAHLERLRAVDPGRLDAALEAARAPLAR